MTDSWYIFEIVDVDGQEMRQRYPQSFLTKEVAEAVMENRKQFPGFANSKFIVEREADDKPVPEGDFEKD